MGINISIVAGQDASASSVNASGTEQHVITDDERTTFHLNDNQLKDAVNAYFGKRPNDAYLHSPTPWDDLYKTYGWPQVQLVLVPQSAEILGITSQPVIVKTQEFTNSSSKSGNFNVSISDTVNNTTSSNWSTGGTLTVGQKITYEVGFLGTGGGGETSLSYSQSWGIGGQESTSVTVGSNSGVSVTLDPGESVIAQLSASRGVMKVRIRYNAYLIGNTAINYNPTYKDHHFWSLGIDGVMASGGIANSVKSTEDIEIGYYSNSKIELVDKKTHAVKASFAMADAPGH
jgi:hypothetical protein